MEETVKHETVLDIGAEQLGRTYGTALLAAAASAGATDEVLAQLGEVVDNAIGASPALAAVFASPRVREEEKQRIIDRLFGDQLHPVLLRFLKVTARHGRLGYLAAIRRAADDQRDEVLGIAVAEVRTAVPLTDEMREQIRQRLEVVLSRKVRIREQVNPSLVGGVVVRVGDTVFDGSVSNRLQMMARQVRTAVARRLVERADMFATSDAAQAT